MILLRGHVVAAFQLVLADHAVCQRALLPARGKSWIAEEVEQSRRIDAYTPTYMPTSTSLPPSAAASLFETEAAMRPAMIRAARSLVVREDELWVLLDEHQVYGRIPDLVVARVNRDALAARIEGGWLRGLNETELRGFRAMRPDRGTKLDRLARLMRVGPATARKVLSGLVRDNFAERTITGSYARLAPVSPILSRVISLEAKRSDPAPALIQAREHRLFADAVYVVFDAAFERRFEAMKPEYARNGVGLVALDASDETHRVLLHPTRSAHRHAVALALSAERALARLLYAPVRQLPESRLPSASAVSEGPGRPLLVGPTANAVQRLLRAAAPSPSDPLPA